MPTKKAEIKQVDNGYIVETNFYCHDSKIYRNLIEVLEELLHFFESAYEMEVVIRRKDEKK